MCPECREPIQLVHQFNPNFDEIVSALQSSLLFASVVGRAGAIIDDIAVIFGGIGLQPNANQNGPPNGPPNDQQNDQQNDQPNEQPNEQPNDQQNEAMHLEPVQQPRHQRVPNPAIERRRRIRHRRFVARLLNLVMRRYQRRHH